MWMLAGLLVVMAVVGAVRVLRRARTRLISEQHVSQTWLDEQHRSKD